MTVHTSSPLAAMREGHPVAWLPQVRPGVGSHTSWGSAAGWQLSNRPRLPRGSDASHARNSTGPTDERCLPQLHASSALEALSAAFGPWPAFWVQGQLAKDRT